MRTIHHGAPLDEDVATMTLAARYLWAYLPCFADREGRLRDSPFAIKASVFPADAVDVEALLAELAIRRHVVRYEVGGRRFIQIRNFGRYQRPHPREIASEIPPVPRGDKPEQHPGTTQAQPGLFPGNTQALPSPSDPDPGSGSGSGSGSVYVPPKATRATPAKKSTFAAARDEFVRHWEKRHGGVKYPFVPKDGIQLAALFKTNPEVAANWGSIVVKYLDDPWPDKNGRHGLAQLCTGIVRYSAPPVDGGRNGKNKTDEMLTRISKWVPPEMRR